MRLIVLKFVLLMAVIGFPNSGQADGDSYSGFAVEGGFCETDCAPPTAAGSDRSSRSSVNPDPIGPNTLGGTPPDTAGAAADDAGGGACNADLVARVEEAASGMSMESIMMMQTAVQSATSNLEGKSARMAHLGNAGVQGTLAALAGKRYLECSGAIDECETVCETAVASGTQPEAEGYLNRCLEQQSVCSEAGLQALMSAIQAGISSMAARKLGGDDNDPAYRSCLKNRPAKECCGEFPNHSACRDPAQPAKPLPPSVPNPDPLNKPSLNDGHGSGPDSVSMPQPASSDPRDPALRQLPIRRTLPKDQGLWPDKALALAALPDLPILPARALAMGKTKSPQQRLWPVEGILKGRR